MIYAPRALLHFGFAAMEARASRATPADRPRPPQVRPVQVQAAPARPVSSRTVVRLWLPLTLLFLVLAPFALLLAPLLYFAPRPYNVRPFATVAALGVVLLSLSGTVVDVDTPEALVRIRIF